MRPDFCVFILTNRRPTNVSTFGMIRRYGYTGPVFFVVDDEDPTLDEYVRLYGDDVLIFSKEEIARRFDEGDNFQDRRSVFYARNACFDLARQKGFRYFMQLDDDYTAFHFRFDGDLKYCYLPAKCMDEALEALVEYFETIPALSLCVSQGGDHIGGVGNSTAESITMKRKAMNTFLCSVDRPFKFLGRVNEDVNTYAALGRQGELFLTVLQVQIVQKNTQTNAGGMTDLYLDGGTYTKSFYSVMFAPSCVKISEMGELHRRIHHQVQWGSAVAQILHEKHRKAPAHA